MPQGIYLFIRQSEAVPGAGVLFRSHDALSPVGLLHFRKKTEVDVDCSVFVYLDLFNQLLQLGIIQFSRRGKSLQAIHDPLTG